MRKKIELETHDNLYCFKKAMSKRNFLKKSSVVTALISKKEFYALQSEQFVEDTFKGSLPAFIAGFRLLCPF